MAKIQTLQDTATNAVIYPETAAEAVYFPDGRNAVQKANELANDISGKEPAFLLSSDLKMDENRILIVTDRAKIKLFDDMWTTIGGTKLENGKYKMSETGKELTFAEALVRYERNGFIVRWNKAAGQYGKYNELTELFELNGITDISYEEALETDRCSNVRYLNNRAFARATTRTLYPIHAGAGNVADSTEYAFFSCPNLEVIRFLNSAYGINNNCFYNSKKIKTIYGRITLSVATVLKDLPLENVSILVGNNAVIDLSSASKLSYESVQYMITNAINTSAVTITVHPDVYAKLIGDTTNEAAAALSDEEAAQWQALVPAALAKNISFATA